MTEQRQDPGTRDRFAELEKRLDGKYAKVARRVTIALVVVGVSLGLAAYGVRQQNVHDSKTLHRIAREGNERRDQTCRLFEKQASESVRQLRQTYEFLVALTPAQRMEPLARFVLANLAKTEAQAHVPAPAYCDAPGVGLPEPNPKIPARPPALAVPAARGRLSNFPH